MNNIWKESQNLKHLLSDRGGIVIYSEGRNYNPDFEGLLGELDYSSYITSDPDDTMLRLPNTYYLKKLLPIYMRFTKCKTIVMTMPDLNQLYIKRSVNPVHYVYLFHSLVSTHMIYRFGAFDHYDSILCAGQHQVKEIRRWEELSDLTPKFLINAGYSKLEKLHGKYKEDNKKTRGINVLVAPTWGKNNLLEVCGGELIKTLLCAGYKVILRLHPETVKQGKYDNYDGVKVETSVANIESIIEADIVITDWSGIGLEYAFGTERPVIFIDTPPKIRNPRYTELGIEPIESHLRSEIGVVVSPGGISSISSVIGGFLSNRGKFCGRLAKLRSEYVFNFGTSAKVGAEYIRSIV